MCSMHRRSGQASGIMPTSGIYGGKTTFASAPSLSIPLSLSTSPLLAVSLSFSLLLFLLHTHSLAIFIFVSLSRSLCSYLVLHLFLSRSLTLPLNLCPLSLSRSLRRTSLEHSSFFSVPLLVFYGMHRSLATPTNITRGPQNRTLSPRKLTAPG